MSRKKHSLMGEVGLLGLGDFGSGLSPLGGALIGGVVAGGTRVALGHISNGTMAGNRELYGLLAGLATSGALAISKKTRHAALGAAFGAILASGVDWLEKILLGTATVTAATASTAAVVAASATSAQQGAVAGMGMARIQALNGLSMRRQPDGTYLNGLGIPKVSYLNGLGIPSIAPQPKAAGAIPGVAGPAFAGTQLGANSPVSLLGAASARSNQVSLLGGPAIHGLSAAYGATLLGAGR